MLGALVLFGVAAAGSFLGARRLIADPALPDRLPDELRDPVRRARDRLLRAQAQAEEVLTEMERERAIAERELRAEYMQRVRRSDSLEP